jgi:hypothetical protein
MTCDFGKQGEIIIYVSRSEQRICSFHSSTASHHHHHHHIITTTTIILELPSDEDGCSYDIGSDKYFSIGIAVFLRWAQKIGT